MKKTWLLVLVLAGVSIASAKTYGITIYDPCTVGTTQLKPGDYKLKLEGTTAVFTNQDTRTNLQAQVKVQTVKDKFDQTAIDTKKVAGMNQIQEIDLAGTHMKIKFD